MLDVRMDCSTQQHLPVRVEGKIERHVAATDSERQGFEFEHAIAQARAEAKIAQRQVLRNDHPARRDVDIRVDSTQLLPIKRPLVFLPQWDEVRVGQRACL